MRLIDAEALLKEKLAVPIAPVLQGERSVYWRFMVPAEKIKDYPTIDAVEVVRCKDCKYSSHEPYKDQADVYVCNYSCWTRAEGGRYPDWYCARAERRTDEQLES